MFSIPVLFVLAEKPDNIFRLLAEEVVQDKDESRLRAFVIERKNAEKRPYFRSVKRLLH